MSLKVGFTGTRNGLTSRQHHAFAALVETFDIGEWHHGDCVGADADCAEWVEGSTEARIVCHPPYDESRRAFTHFNDEIREPKTHFERNRAIVDETDFLIACPAEMSHQTRGGTWYTVDYAKKRNRDVFIVWPDGTVLLQNRKPVVDPAQGNLF